jgi:hypothetical protein
MKTKPQRYHEVLSLAPRLALVVPDASALRNRRRVESGLRVWFASREGDWMEALRTGEPTRRRDRLS